jgi:hypothetical protein
MSNFEAGNTTDDYETYDAYDDYEDEEFEEDGSEEGYETYEAYDDYEDEENNEDSSEGIQNDIEVEENANKNLNYFQQLKETILPILFTKIKSAKDSNSLLQGILDTSKYYCFASNLSDEKCINVLNKLGNFDSNISENDVKAASLFVLSATYYLTGVDSLRAGEVFVGDGGKLGFDKSIPMFKSSVQNCKISSLGDYANSSDDDVKAFIQQKLHLGINNCSIEEYFTNHIYINDLNTISEVIKPIDSVAEDKAKAALGYAHTQISIAVKKIMNTYRDLFSSAYQVVKPVGLLTSNGIAFIENGVIKYEDTSFEAYQIFQYLSKMLGISEVSSRDFDINLIVLNFLNPQEKGTKLYFPNKLIEFAFGCSSCSNNSDINSYPAISDIKSWNDYTSKIVEPLISSICRKTILHLFSKKGYLKDDTYKSPQAFELVKDMLDYLYRNLTPCMIVSNWKEVADNTLDVHSSKSLAGFKLRVTDLDKSLPLGVEVTEYIVNNIFGGLKGDSDAVCETIVPLGSKTSYSVCDIQHKFSPSLVNGEPLFAYTALNSLKKSGKTPSWKNLILGKKDDDSILTVGEDISFNKKLVHWVLAGSRSGKGVMTLNILAGALASNKPVFYLDNKPDMASMFRSSQLSGGKMFCINGDYDAHFDKTFNSCRPDSFNWDKNIPAFIREQLGNDYSSYAPIFYLRAAMFLTSLIYVRGSVRADRKLYEPLGGKEGVAIVIDEISAADSAISAMLDKNGIFGNNFYSAPTLSEAENKKNKSPKTGQPIVTPFGCYSTDLIRSLNATFRTIGGQWKLKGLTGGGTEGDVSDIFMIGQNIHEVDTSKMDYIPTNDDNMNRTSGNAFYNFLFNLGCDAFFGYNVDHPEYMWSGDEAASEGSKASTRLNATARNFAYVNHFDAGTVNTMLDNKMGGKSSKDISDNALYFKPFLIFNDAKEDSPYVAEDFKRACELAHLDFDKVKNMHRRENGILEPEIGFIPYVNAQGSKADSIQTVLAKSYDIANRLIRAYGYKGDCIEFIYDLRPEAMFTAQSLLNAYRGSSKEPVSKLYNQFFSNQDVTKVIDTNIKDVDGVDYNNLSEQMGYDTQIPSESNLHQTTEKTRTESPEATSKISIEDEYRMCINKYISEHPHPLDELGTKLEEELKIMIRGCMRMEKGVLNAENEKLLKREFSLLKMK